MSVDELFHSSTLLLQARVLTKFIIEMFVTDIMSTSGLLTHEKEPRMNGFML